MNVKKIVQKIQGSHISENKYTDKMKKKTDKVDKNPANEEH
jgi:hypothetical protein